MPSVRVRPTTVIYSFIIRHLSQQDSEELMTLLDVWADEGEIDNYTLARNSAQDVDELDIIMRSSTEHSDWTTALRKFLEEGRVVRNDSLSPDDNLKRMVGGRADPEGGDRIGAALRALDDLDGKDQP